MILTVHERKKKSEITEVVVYGNNVPIIYVPFLSSLKNHRRHEKDIKIKRQRQRGSERERERQCVCLCGGIDTAPFGWHTEKPEEQLFHEAQEVLTNPISNHAILQGFATEVFGLEPLNANQYLHSVLGLCHYCMHGSRGCLGCFTKPSVIIAVDEPSKGLRIQGRPVRKSSESEDIWSSSTMDMEYGAVPSQRSVSSIQALDPQSTSSTSSLNTPEFINHGLLLWNQTRQQWLGNKNSQKRTQIREPRICWNATYESLLGTSKPFPQPVPLSEMIDFLVDIWEQEGLYD